MSGWSKIRRSLTCGALAVIVIFVQADCGNRKESESEPSSEAQPATPSLFTVSRTQLARLHLGPVRSTTWRINVQTTGTVDCDADHTTQAITQVSGPITRILVDNVSYLKAGDALLYVSSPDITNAVATYKKARDQQNHAQFALYLDKDLLSHATAAVKDVESS